MAQEKQIRELIPIEDRNGRQAVSARTLHVFLESKKDFSDWIKFKINQCDLVENQDYEVLHPKFGEQKGRGGHNKIEYALTIDAAKEISMVEGNERGKQARRYFIECERQLKAVTLTLPNFSNPAEAARAWAEQYEAKQLEAKRADVAEQQVVTLSHEIEEMKPKVSYYDMILNNKSTVLTTQIAQDYGMTAKDFNIRLYDLRIQHKMKEQWILYAPYISQGYVHSKPVEITHRDGHKSIKYNSEWTQKGRLFLYDILKKNNILPLIER